MKRLSPWPIAVLGVVGLPGLVLAVRLAAWPLTSSGLPKPGARAASRPALAEPPHVPPPESLAAVVIARDPFRVGHRPAGAAYDPTQADAVDAPPPPKPTLTVLGIIWDGGQDPTALLVGLPTVDGVRPVRQGEVYGPLRITRIAVHEVRVTGLDTVWTLTVHEPWR